jgi:multidrug resistance efflux pump
MTASARRSGNALTFSLVAIVVVAGLSLGGWWLFDRGGGDVGLKLITSTVFQGPYEHVISEQGSVENASSIELKCQVKSRGGSGGGGGSGVAIINVVPEGTLAAPGDVLVELDSSALEQEKVTQLIQVTGQKALRIQSENKLAAAQIARQEYENGTFVEMEKLLIADAYLAQQTLNTAEAGLIAAKRLFERGIVTAKQVESAHVAVEDTTNRLAAANAKLDNLRQYTREKMLKTFDSDIATATADLSAQQGKLSLEESKLKDIEDQIAKCTIRAPAAGVVVYANKYDLGGNNVQVDFAVMPGATVRERQTIIRLPSSSEMQVRATVNEARVTLVRPGLPVTIRVDALKDQLIRGEVTRVNPYAEPSVWSSGNVKKYATFIKVFDPPPDLRSGMNAEVRIHIEQQPEALQVPVQALAQHQGRFFSLVKDGDRYVTHEVTIRTTNDKVATIERGLAEGDVVVMSPRRAGGRLVLPEPPDRTPVQVAGERRPGGKGTKGVPPEPAGGGE